MWELIESRVGAGDFGMVAHGVSLHFSQCRVLGEVQSDTNNIIEFLNNWKDYASENRVQLLSHHR